ncbi:MAG: DUF4388 domain-containing protein [Holophagales bacterium]|nr:DUF4388 domain-containing protein [Holophagales bacterium]
MICLLLDTYPYCSPSHPLSMTQILILDDDPILPTALASLLEAEGDEVRIFERASDLRKAASGSHADLVLLDLGLPPGDDEPSPVELVRHLRRNSATRSLFVLARIGAGHSRLRLQALEAGVDELVPEDCELEELMLRIRRRLDSRTGEIPVLHGSLNNRQLVELFQYVQQAGQSGLVRVLGRAGSGRVELERGRAVHAEFGQLEGESAILAMLGVEKGRFHLVPSPPASREPVAGSEEGIDLQSVLLTSAWLQDELRDRAEILPPRSAALELAGESHVESLPEVLLDAFGGVPLEAVEQQLEQAPGLRRFDLHESELGAPKEIDLALAVLVEAGRVSRLVEIDTPSTLELRASSALQWAVQALFERLRRAGELGGGESRGAAGPAFRIWMLTEEGAGALLRMAFERESSHWLGGLRRQLSRGPRGGLELPTAAGRLELQVGALGEVSAERIAAELTPAKATAPGGGVLVWLHAGVAHSELTSLARELAAAGSDAALPSVVLVAEAENAKIAAEGAFGGYARVWITPYPPRTPAGMLRFFPVHPEARGRAKKAGRRA